MDQPLYLCGHLIKQLLGSGVQQSVYLTQTNQAIKRTDVKDNFPEELIVELDILSRVNHENVVSLLEVNFINNEVCLLLPAGNITLNKFIKQNFGALNGTNKTDISNSLIKGVDYLHKNFILHQDLHADNVLIYIDSENRATLKIIDFGLAINFFDKVRKIKCSTLLCPPELVLKLTKEIGPEFDNWYLGQLIYFVWNGVYPFYHPNIPKNKKEESVIYLIRKGIGLTQEQEQKYKVTIKKEDRRHFDDLFKDWQFNMPRDFNLLVSDPLERKDLVKFFKEETKLISYPPLIISFQYLSLNSWKRNGAFLQQLNNELGQDENIMWEALEILLSYGKKESIDEENIKSLSVTCLYLANVLMNNKPAYKEDYLSVEPDLDYWIYHIVKKLLGKLFRPTVKMFHPDWSNSRVRTKYML